MECHSHTWAIFQIMQGFQENTNTINTEQRLFAQAGNLCFYDDDK